MQFELKHIIKEQVCKVTFTNPHKLKPASWKILNSVFQRFGANQCDNAAYLFPSFIRGCILEEIISNTCYVCGGIMQDGEALDNTLISYDDFGGDAGNRGTTQSKDGEAKLIKVRKCQSCGHSHTV